MLKKVEKLKLDGVQDVLLKRRRRDWATCDTAFLQFNKNLPDCERHQPFCAVQCMWGCCLLRWFLDPRFGCGDVTLACLRVSTVFVEKMGATTSDVHRD